MLISFIPHLGTRLRLRRLQLALKKIPQPKHVLDAGCGHGVLTKYLTYKTSSVIGIDTDRNRLKIAKTLGVNAVYADIYHLPFKNNEFDLVLCFEVLEHLSADRAAVKELTRVVKPRGFLVSSFPGLAATENVYLELKHIRRGYSKTEAKKLFSDWKLIGYWPYGTTDWGRMLLMLNYKLGWIGMVFVPLFDFLLLFENGQQEPVSSQVMLWQKK